MSVFGSGFIPPVSVTQAAGGLGQATATVSPAAREAERRRIASAKRVRSEDEVDLQATTVETDDAVRDLARNGDEETTEDRQKQDHYLPQKAGEQKPPARPHLDIQA